MIGSRIVGTESVKNLGSIVGRDSTESAVIKRPLIVFSSVRLHRCTQVGRGNPGNISTTNATMVLCTRYAGYKLVLFS